MANSVAMRDEGGDKRDEDSVVPERSKGGARDNKVTDGYGR